MRKQKQTPGNDERLRYCAGSTSIFAIRVFYVIRISSFLFNPVPNLIQLSQIGISKPLALRLQHVLEAIESRDKLVGSGLQRAFGIEFAFAREIDDCKQQIADLVLDRVFGRRGDTNPSCGGPILRRDRLF